MDIVAILGTGVSGFSFLLLYISYKLTSSIQQRILDVNLKDMDVEKLNVWGIIADKHTFGNDPNDVLFWILDIAGFAMHTVGRIDLESRLAVFLNDFVHTRRAITLRRFVVFGQVEVDRYRFVYECQV